MCWNCNHINVLRSFFFALYVLYCSILTTHLMSITWICSALNKKLCQKSCEKSIFTIGNYLSTIINRIHCLQNCNSFKKKSLHIKWIGGNSNVGNSIFAWKGRELRNTRKNKKIFLSTFRYSDDLNCAQIKLIFTGDNNVNHSQRY